jgi:3-oxoacyl-[acyl-carrier protein] reductase
MDLGLAGKRALVTGGTRGIGQAISRALAAEGCDVAICARNSDAVAVEVEALAGIGAGRASGQGLDVRDRAAVKAWADDSAAAFGGMDILVANVSGFGLTTDEAGWRQAFEGDILGTLNAVDGARPHIEASDAGAIVAISSIAAVEFFGGARPYNAIKAALITYVSNLANELAPIGVRANSVSPGTIFFEGGVWDDRRLNQPEVYNGALASNPMGRMGTPEEVAAATVFLASPAAAFITGTNIIVDGGLTKRVQF